MVFIQYIITGGKGAEEKVLKTDRPLDTPTAAMNYKVSVTGIPSRSQLSY